MDPVSVGLGLLNMFQTSKANRRAEQVAEAQYEYSKKGWRQNKKKLKRDYDYLVDKIYNEEANFDRMRDYKDRVALDAYQYGLQIDAIEQGLQKRLYNKSEDLYKRSIDSSVEGRAQAYETVQARLRETYQAAAFDNEEEILKSIAASGSSLARGQAGRSADKQQQAILASFGRDQAVLAASLMSANDQADRDINAINAQFNDAVLRADANRMLPPIPKPARPVPLAAPDMAFMLPPELQKFDFGPKPQKYAAATQNPFLSFMQAAAPGISSSIGNIGVQQAGTMAPVPFSAYSGNTAGNLFNTAPSSYSIPSSAIPMTSISRTGY